jgi:hypothetical protein
MLIAIIDATGATLDAKVELQDGAITLHSRGGAFGKPNLRNPDYRPALRLILERLQATGFAPSGVWLDSAVAQKWPEKERLLLDAAELGSPVDEVVTLIGKRSAAKGRPTGATGHGNSTKRVRIGVPSVSIGRLSEALAFAELGSKQRLPVSTQRLVRPSMIDDAIEAFLAGAAHSFHGSRDYDLLLPSGERLPPKAIFGLALGKVIGRPAKPTDFSAGWGEPCFDIIEEAGYPIIPKAAKDQPSPDADDERTWAEGSQIRVLHLRRERAPGLATMKKRRFTDVHGRLFCERCGIVPSESLGPFGDACIEVHHRTTAVAKMNGTTRTRLSDLQCLCANCHRLVHREAL